MVLPKQVMEKYRSITNGLQHAKEPGEPEPLMVFSIIVFTFPNYNISEVDLHLGFGLAR